MQPRGTSAYLAELIGTFFLVLFIALVVTVNSDAGLGYTDVAVVALAHAFVLMMIVATIGAASGAHVNPAVTIALAALRKIAPADAAIYVVVQLAGAILAVLVVKLLIQDGSADAASFGAPAVAQNFLDGSAAAGFLGELLGAFALMWAIMGVLVNPAAAKEWAPLVVGATLGLAVMALAPMTGASLNPARAFGPALIATNFGEGATFVFVYVAGPIAGALAAAFAYQAAILGDRPSARPVDKLG
ncbi:MAG TPA: aquaporin [Solirubrobacteraceae bacterium]|nr:aquaporin [Solirubrobacteraceae bacterium]